MQFPFCRITNNFYFPSNNVHTNLKIVLSEVEDRTIFSHQVKSLSHLREGRVASISHLLAANDNEPGHQAVDRKAAHPAKTRFVMSDAAHVKLGNRLAEFVEHVKEAVNFFDHLI